MPFTTTEQFIVLAVALLGGWLLGYASAPSPRKWKRRVRAQSESFTAYHAEAEDRLRAANQRASGLKAEADALRADHAEAQRTIAELRASAVGAPAAVFAVEPVAHAGPALTPTDTESAGAHEISESGMPGKDFFASGARDALIRIRGIDDVLDARLSALGVTRFEDLEQLSAEDEMALEQRLALPAGFIAREQWRTQAALLRTGRDEDHATHFGPVEAAPLA